MNTLRARRAGPCFVFLASLLAACADSPSPTIGEAASAITSSYGPGCTGRRWVGRSSAPNACPAGPYDWSATPIFVSVSPTAPGLGAYCLYEWLGGPGLAPSPRIAALDAALTPQGVTALDEDCVVVGPLGASDDLRTWSNQQLLAGAGASDPLPSGAPTTIRVAVADSSPAAAQGSIPHGQLDHGYTMAWIARDLTCPEAGPCLSHVTTELALPRVTNDEVDPINGGYFGSRVELAQAIFAAVESWKTSAEDQPRLVINLSVGWERDAGCGKPSIPASMTTSQDVVLAALTHAACHGALVIAAAGNDPGGGLPIYSGPNPMAHGPTCPAAWSTVPAPTALQCAGFEAPGYAASLPPHPRFYQMPPQPPQSPVDDALLYAAGGLDHADRPITRSRTGGAPRIAALAFQGVAGDPADSLPQPLTGTSVSAAVTSGIAAAVWAYRPELTAPEVMDVVYRSGADLDRTADFASPDVDAAVRRIGRCDAIQAACFDGAAHDLCPTQPTACALHGATERQNPELPPDAVALLQTRFDAATPYDFLPPLDELPSPFDEYRALAAAPWVNPQPDHPPCSVCVFSMLDNLLSVALDPDYPSYLTLSRMTLTLAGPSVADPSRSVTLTIQPRYPETMTSATAPFEVERIDWSPLTRVDTAALSWLSFDTRTGAAGSVQEQILLR